VWRRAAPCRAGWSSAGRNSAEATRRRSRAVVCCLAHRPDCRSSARSVTRRVRFEQRARRLPVGEPDRVSTAAPEPSWSHRGMWYPCDQKSRYRGSAGGPPGPPGAGTVLGRGSEPRSAGGDDPPSVRAGAVARSAGCDRPPDVLRTGRAPRCGCRSSGVVAGPVPRVRSAPRPSCRSPSEGRPARARVPGRMPPAPHIGRSRPSPGSALPARPRRMRPVGGRTSDRDATRPLPGGRTRARDRGGPASSSAGPARQARSATGAGRAGPGCPRPTPYRAWWPDRCAEFGRNRPPRHLPTRLCRTGRGRMSHP
jgi:hypothetical protein